VDLDLDRTAINVDDGCQVFDEFHHTAHGFLHDERNLASFLVIELRLTNFIGLEIAVDQAEWCAEILVEKVEEWLFGSLEFLTNNSAYL